jgi:hypothetical protein
MISELKLDALRRALATVEYRAQVADGGIVHIVQVKQRSNPGTIFGQVAADGTVHIVQRSKPGTIFGHTPLCLLRQSISVISGGAAGLLIATYVTPPSPHTAVNLFAYAMLYWALRPSRHMWATLTGFRATLAGLSVQGLTNTAALLAGSKRPAVQAEWVAHIAGESGHDPASWQKVKQAFGFLTSAVYYRCSDMAEAIWVPVDVILKSRALSNIFVMIPTMVAGWLVLRHEGTLGLINSAESIVAVAGVLYGLIRTGRWWRDVKPPEPKARRAEKLW